MLITLAFLNRLQDIQIKEQRHAEAEQAIAAKKMALEQNQRKVSIPMTSTRLYRCHQTLMALIPAIYSTMSMMLPEPRSCSTSTLQVTARDKARLLASLVTTTLRPELKVHLLPVDRVTRLALPLVTSL
jgi:hypothetical protein